MRAIVVHEVGGPEVMKLEDIEAPEPGPGQVRIRTGAIGVNFIDTYHRNGLYKLALPFTPGREAAGVVDAVGEGVARPSVGDRVACHGVAGCYAEAVLATPGALVSVPEDVPTDQAAAIMLQGLTAHYLAHSTFPLREGHVALVTAAAGGVGHLLVQMAVRAGARVVGTASTEAKAELARSSGAHEVILYRERDLAEEARRLTDGRGVDVVYDSVGKDTFDRSLDALRPRGMLVLYGQSSGPVAPVNPQVLNAKGSLYLTRPTLGSYTADRAELDARANDLFSWIRDGELEVRVDTTFPLAEAVEAHRYIEAGRTQGKVLLSP